MTARTSRRAVATAAALCLSVSLAACGRGGDPAPAASPAPGAGATGDATTRDPTQDEVRAAAAEYLAAVGAEVASVMVKDHHVGLYVRGKPAWPLDTFVTQMPRAAETARAMLVRFPTLNDVDVCGDGPWLEHGPGVTFVPAVRVQVFRAQLPNLPERFDSPAQVLGLGLVEPHRLEHFLDNRIRTESQAYRTAYKNAGSAAK